jgi:hypothetical protein
MKKIKLVLGWMLIFSLSSGFLSQNQEMEGFTPLFDGDTLAGWRKLTEYSGDYGKWTVKDGALIGEQYPEGQGGLLVTEQKFSDVEIYADVKADYPVDSGIFLRVQPDVLSYQVTIDYRPDGEIGALYCPGGGEFLMHNPEGQSYWKKGAYNRVRTRIQGQPPRIQAWINGHQVLDYSDQLLDGKPRVPASGYFGVQVHPGSSWGEGNKIYFRKILIKRLDE